MKIRQARRHGPLRLLDTYCCDGGAARGYQRAGFHVTGVDVVERPNYCGDDFVKSDAIEYIIKYGHLYDAIHASPPCQDHTTLTKGNRKRRNAKPDQHINLIPGTRAALDLVGKPYVIENVMGAGAEMRTDLKLCGLMFGLKVYRHRIFELSGFTVDAPEHPTHKGHRVAGWRHGQRYEGDMVAVYGEGGGKGSVSDWQAAMGIDWTDDKATLAEAIPPAYTERIGFVLYDRLTRAGLTLAA